MPRKTRYRIIAGTCIAWLIACAIYCPPRLQAQNAVSNAVPGAVPSAVPRYEVDPFWAKLPDNWVVGPLGGACVDARDNVFVLHRQEGLTEAMLKGRDRPGEVKSRIKAPPVMEFDPQGKLVNSWGIQRSWETTCTTAWWIRT
jgi:hypothetical protein